MVETQDWGRDRDAREMPSELRREKSTRVLGIGLCERYTLYRHRYLMAHLCRIHLYKSIRILHPQILSSELRLHNFIS